MSRFFRSADSTPSGESEPDDDDDDKTEDISNNLNQNSSGSKSNTDVDRISAEWTASHRDFLLHALLEERCIEEVRKRHSDIHPSLRPGLDSPHIRAEANERYQNICARLASYNLISTGLEGDQHAVTRQRYREGLDAIGQQHRSTTTIPTPVQQLHTNDDTQALALRDHQHGRVTFERSYGPGDHATMPLALRRLLTSPEHFERSTMHSDRALIFTTSQRGLSPSPSFLQARYHHDFEELNILGRGGYGVVYHVRHRLDNQDYAVKKVPLSTTRLQRIQERGESEVQKVLRELRTLARLDHPNIVRYYGGWVEWVDRVVPADIVHSNTDSYLLSTDLSDAVLGAEDSRIKTSDRVVPVNSPDEPEVLFESSSSTSIQDTWETSIKDASPPVSGGYRLQRTATRSTIASSSDETVEEIGRQIDPSISMQSIQSNISGVSFTEPTLALHMQMSLHPMTLADFLAPPVTVEPDPHVAPPLSHCFHLDPSVSILLAVLSGIEYLHGEGIVHRDIKPANIFLSACTNSRSTGGSVDLMSCFDCRARNNLNPMRLEVRIGDFGLVTVADPDGSALPVSEAVGTELYRPFEAEVQHPSLDIFALGIVAFELMWKFDTRMERLLVLQQLRCGKFPAGFAERLGEKRGQAMEECIATMLTQGENGLEIQALRQRLSGLTSTHVR